MLRIAVQAKRTLFEETMALLGESDIKLSTTKRTLLVQSSNFPIEVLFLRDDDIPQTVATGVADLGICWRKRIYGKGRRCGNHQTFWDSVSVAFHWLCRKILNIPVCHGLTVRRSLLLIRLFFATSWRKNGVNAEIHVITGSVEVSPGIGLADAIFDIVSSGSTLVSNRLKEVEAVMESEALLIGNKNMSDEKKKCSKNCCSAWMQ